MCGAIGLFVGCSAMASCPKRLLAKTGPVGSEEGSYRSPLDNWYERASVRTASKPTLEPDDGRRLFSPALVPVARHPLVTALPAKRFEELLVRHAYRYLDFTAKLEHLVVNRTAMRIAHGASGVEVPEAMRLDAYKLYCDEAFHALMAAELLRDLHARSGVPRPDEPPYFLTRLARLQESAGADLAWLVELLFVITSETLISSTLAEAPRDDNLPGALRDLIAHHALDEGRHHVYFAAVLRYLWAQLTPSLRRTAGRLLPELIMTFLEPDRPAVRAELLALGLSPDEAEEVLDEVYSPPAVAAYARVVSRHTIRHFAAVGALDDPATCEELASAGLLDQPLAEARS